MSLKKFLIYKFSPKSLLFKLIMINPNHVVKNIPPNISSESPLPDMLNWLLKKLFKKYKFYQANIKQKIKGPQRSQAFN